MAWRVHCVFPDSSVAQLLSLLSLDAFVCIKNVPHEQLSLRFVFVSVGSKLSVLRVQFCARP